MNTEEIALDSSLLSVKYRIDVKGSKVRIGVKIKNRGKVFKNLQTRGKIF